MGESFGEALFAIRNFYGVSRKTIHRDTGIQTATLSRLESGAALPSRETVDRLVSGLRLELGPAARLYLAAGFIPSSPKIRAILATMMTTDPATVTRPLAMTRLATRADLVLSQHRRVVDSRAVEMYRCRPLTVRAK